MYFNVILAYTHWSANWSFFLQIYPSKHLEFIFILPRLRATSPAILIPLNVITSVNKNPTDATICRYLFTAKLLYMFRVSQHPSSGVLKTVPAASGTGHTTCTAAPLQRGLIGTLEGSSGTSSMTYTGGCGYSF